MDFSLMQNFLKFQNISTDKLDCDHTTRITENLKSGISKLSPAEKKEMNNAIMCVMAFFVHMSKFRPEIIINSDYDE